MQYAYEGGCAGTSIAHSNNNMGFHTVGMTAASIVQPPVCLHAVSVKLTCRRSAFHSNCNSQLRLARPAVRALTCRTRTVMGLPIPIIGELAAGNMLVAVQRVAHKLKPQWCLQDLCSTHSLQRLHTRSELQGSGPIMTRRALIAHKKRS